MAGRKMRCHYDVLEVSRGADADELKKQYRRMALRWHPDKNRDNMEEAEHRIKEINAAYEVLSDPNERAWYDDHRDAILRGGDGTAGADGTESSAANLWTYFRASCFEGFEDDENGFYAVYGRAFAEIMRVERESGVGEPAAMPSFGNSRSSDEDVDAFYARWGSFVSKLSFGWADLYNPKEAVNRYQRRLIDKENRKARDTERRAYNEQVRSLVNYVKKRDKRVLKLEVARQRERERRERERLAAIDEKKRLRREAREQWREHYEEDIAAQLAEAEVSGERLFRLADEDLDDAAAEARAHAEAHDELVVWHCEACSKDFKSEKQLRNHENSKKHKEALKKLQKRMQREEEMLRAALEQEQADAEAALDSGDDSDDGIDASVPKAGATSEDGDGAPDADDGGNDGESDGSADSDDGDSSDSEPDFGAFGSFAQQDDDDDFDETSEEDEEEEVLDEGGDTGAEKEEELEVDDHLDEGNEGDAVDPPVAPPAETASEDPAPAAGKAKGKAAASKQTKQSGKSQGTSETPTEHFCVVCSTYFTSRNKLFQHINATNHAVAPDTVKSAVKAADVGAGGKRKGKKAKGKRR